MYPLYYVYTLTVKNKIPCFITIIGGVLNVVSIWFDPLGKLFGGWGLYEDGQFTTESIENFMLFVPFSILLLWAFQKELLGESENIRFGKTVWEATKVVAIFSFMIEFTQLLFHLGTFQISDLTYNTLGGAVGGVIYYLGYSRRRKK